MHHRCGQGRGETSWPSKLRSDDRSCAKQIEHHWSMISGVPLSGPCLDYEQIMPISYWLQVCCSTWSDAGAGIDDHADSEQGSKGCFNGKGQAGGDASAKGWKSRVAKEKLITASLAFVQVSIDSYWTTNDKVRASEKKQPFLTWPLWKYIHWSYSKSIRSTKSGPSRSFAFWYSSSSWVRLRFVSWPWYKYSVGLAPIMM